MMHGLNFQNGRRRQVVQKNSAFDLRLDNPAVHFVGQVGMGIKHTNRRPLGYRVSDTGTRDLGNECASEGARPLDGPTQIEVARIKAWRVWPFRMTQVQPT